MRWVSAVALVALVVSSLGVRPSEAQTRLEKVQGDRIRITQDGFWIYNDLAGGLEAARNSGAPILVTLRCIPCEECVKLDEELIESDPELTELLNKFVRVRLVSTNGLDLSTFQYDYDQSFTMLMMNADGTVYGRYGTRSDRTEWEDDVSIDGLARTLEAALELHAGYPGNRAALSGKQGGEPLFATPNDAPTLARFPRRLEFDDDVVKNCIHCHMIGDAQRDLFRARREPIPDEILFQYPHPKAVGMIVDPHSRATLREVVADSLAAEAGFRKGDEIVSLEGQPILSIADMQWVLHHADARDSVAVVVRRDGRERTLTLTLPEGWRQLDDISWRVSAWGLRRMLTGGLKLGTLDDAGRTRLRIPAGRMALIVEHVGQYNEHAAAKNAGFQQDDVIIAFDGQEDLMRETDLFAYAAAHCMAGEKVEVTVLRGRERRTLQLPMQN